MLLGGALLLVDGTDRVPSAFTFTDQTAVELSSTITSAPITVTGLGGSYPISVSGGTYSINGGSYTSAAGVVGHGDQIRARHTSSGSALTATNTVVTIGGVSDTFTSTTRVPGSTYIGMDNRGGTQHTLPAGWAAGDIAIVFGGKYFADMTIDAGWTELAYVLLDGQWRQKLWYRVLQGGDVGPTPTSETSQLVVYRTGSSVHLIGSPILNSGTTLTFPGFTKNAGSRRIVAMSWDNDDATNATAPSGFVDRGGALISNAGNYRHDTVDADPADYTNGASIVVGGFVNGQSQIGVLMEIR